MCQRGVSALHLGSDESLSTSIPRGVQLDEAVPVLRDGKDLCSRSKGNAVRIPEACDAKTHNKPIIHAF